METIKHSDAYSDTSIHTYTGTIFTVYKSFKSSSPHHHSKSIKHIGINRAVRGTRLKWCLTVERHNPEESVKHVESWIPLEVPPPPTAITFPFLIHTVVGCRLLSIPPHPHTVSFSLVSLFHLLFNSLHSVYIPFHSPPSVHTLLVFPHFSFKSGPPSKVDTLLKRLRHPPLYLLI